MADFTYTPDRVVEEEVVFNTLVSRFENGVEQRRSKWANPLRKWKLYFKIRTQTEMEAVRDFFINKKGAYSSFTWTNPNDNVTYTVRFVEDSFKFERQHYQIYNFEVAFQEVR